MMTVWERDPMYWRRGRTAARPHLQDVDDVVLQGLGIRAEDRLDTVADLDDTRGPEAFQTSLIHLALIGDFHAQARDAGVDIHEVLPAAERRDDLLGLTVGGDWGGGHRHGRGTRAAGLHCSDRLGALAEVGLFLGLELGFRLASRSRACSTS